MDNKNFKNTDKATDGWQVLRMQSELVKGFDTLYELGQSVCVYGASRVQPNTNWYNEAVKFGKLMADEGFNIITGGGPGIMEAINKGAKSSSKGKSVGIGIELPFEQGMNEHVEVGMECRYFFTRKLMFLKYSQGFVAFPGGIGTLDELTETITLAQTGQVPKFPIILVGKSYWSGLLTWIKDTIVANKLMSESDLYLFRVVDTAEEAVNKIIEFHSKYRNDTIVNF